MKFLKFLLLFITAGASLNAVMFKGTVIDSFTGKPVENVKVVIFKKDTTLYTDENGKFEIELERRSYHLDLINSSYLEKHLFLDAAKNDSAVFRLTPMNYESKELLVTDHKSLIKQQSTISKSELNRFSSEDISKLLEMKLASSTSEMGEAVSRPVINGLSGNRMNIISGEFSSKDLSANSPDHAQAYTLNSVDEIQIIKNAELVKYSSSLMGKSVRTKDNIDIENKIKTSNLTLNSSFSSANQKGAAGFNYTSPMLLDGININGSYKSSSDINTPEGVLANTQQELYDFSGAAFYEAGEFSINPKASYFKKDYGIPGGFVGSHPNGVNIEMRKHTVGLTSSYHLHQEFVEQFNFDLSRSFYDHKEFESSGSLGAQFRFLSYSGKFELEQHEGPVFTEGSMGVSFEHKKNELGGFVFIPGNTYQNYAAYVYESMKFDNLNILLGLRYDKTEVLLDRPIEFENETIKERNFEVFSGALGFNYKLTEELYLNLDLSRSNRIPEPEELFSEGPHLAAYSYEIGNPNLESEKGFSYSFEVNYIEELTNVSLEAFIYDYENYITPINTGDTNYSTLLPIYRQTGVKALLYGFNFHFDREIIEDLKLNFNTNYTIGRNKTEDIYLPMIPPFKTNASLNYKLSDWELGINSEIAAAQRKTGEFEEATDGYFIFGLSVDKLFEFEESAAKLGLRIENLTNSTYRNHLSRIKSIMPQPGINFIINGSYFL